MSRIAGGHHVFGVKHLLGEFGDSQGTVLLAASAGKWGKTWHEKVKTRKGDHVNSQFS